MNVFDRKDIECCLNEVGDIWLIRVFAVRMALLSLPYLSNNERHIDKDFLWFWNEDEREKYLLSVLQAAQASWVSVRFRNSEAAIAANSFNASDAAIAATNQKYASYALCAANATTYAANTAVDNYIPMAASHAEAAADCATYAIEPSFFHHYARGILSVFQITFLIKSKRLDELVYVQNYLLDIKTLSSFNSSFYQRIKSWFDPELRHHQEQLKFLENLMRRTKLQEKIFIKNLREFGNGFDYWAEWFDARFRGEDVEDKCLAIRSCNLPDEILVLSPAEINAHLKSLAQQAAQGTLN